MEAEDPEASFDATRKGGGGASRSRCGRTSPGPRAKGEAIAGRLSVDGVRGGFVWDRKGVDNIGIRSATSLPLLLLEELTGLERCDTGAEFAAECEGLASVSTVRTDACEALDAFH